MSEDQDNQHEHEGDDTFNGDDKELGSLTPEQREAALKENLTPFDIPQEEFDGVRDIMTEFINHFHPDATEAGFSPADINMSHLSEARNEAFRRMGFGHDEFHMMEGIGKWVSQIADNAETFSRIATSPIVAIGFLKSEDVELETLDKLNTIYGNCIGSTPASSVVFATIQSMFSLEAARRHMILAHEELGEEVLNVAMHALAMAATNQSMVLAYAVRRMFDEDPCDCPDRLADLFGDDADITPHGAEVGMELDDELAKLLAEEGDD